MATEEKESSTCLQSVEVQKFMSGKTLERSLNEINGQIPHNPGKAHCQDDALHKNTKGFRGDNKCLELSAKNIHDIASAYEEKTNAEEKNKVRCNYNSEVRETKSDVTLIVICSYSLSSPLKYTEERNEQLKLFSREMEDCAPEAMRKLVVQFPWSVKKFLEEKEEKDDTNGKDEDETTDSDLEAVSIILPKSTDEVKQMMLSERKIEGKYVPVISPENDLGTNARRMASMCELLKDNREEPVYPIWIKDRLFLATGNVAVSKEIVSPFVVQLPKSEKISNNHKPGQITKLNIKNVGNVEELTIQVGPE
jgi:hypothetical protein